MIFKPNPFFLEYFLYESKDFFRIISCVARICGAVFLVCWFVKLYMCLSLWKNETENFQYFSIHFNNFRPISILSVVWFLLLLLWTKQRRKEQQSYCKLRLSVFLQTMNWILLWIVWFYWIHLDSMCLVSLRPAVLALTIITPLENTFFVFFAFFFITKLAIESNL